MESFISRKVCPNCGSSPLKGWTELNRDEQLVAERLPASAEASIDERKKHRFCTRCWFETDDRGEQFA